MSDNSRETDLLDAAGAVQLAGSGVGTMGSSVTFAIAILGEGREEVRGNVAVEGLGSEREARKEKSPAVSIELIQTFLLRINRHIRTRHIGEESEKAARDRRDRVQVASRQGLLSTLTVYAKPTPSAATILLSLDTPSILFPHLSWPAEECGPTSEGYLENTLHASSPNPSR